MATFREQITKTLKAKPLLPEDQLIDLICEWHEKQRQDDANRLAKARELFKQIRQAYKKKIITDEHDTIIKKLLWPTPTNAATAKK